MGLPTIDYSKIKRVLVIKLRHHGDVLLSTPVISALKDAYPHLEIDAVVYKDTQDMMSGHPDLSELFVIDRNWKKLGFWKQFQAERGFTQSLKARNYDVVFHLTEHWRGARLVRAIKPQYAITHQHPNREKSKYWRNTFTHRYRVPSTPRHTIEKHLDALRCTGLQPTQRKTKLSFESALPWFQETAETYNFTAGDYIVFHPTSRWLFKTWPVEKAAELINTLVEKGYKVVMSAAPDQKEMDMVALIKQNIHVEFVDLTGQMTLKQLAALLAHAKGFVGMDSVPMHMADSFDIPLVALFGPSGDKEWGPRGQQSTVLTSDDSCRPCGMDGCAGSKISDCLVKIPVSTVISAFESRIRNEVFHAG